MRQPKVIVFDWDGTLADSISQIVMSIQQAVQWAELPSRTDAQVSDIIGLGLAEAMMTLYPDITKAEVEKTMAAYRDAFRGRMEEGAGASPLFTGAKTVLDGLIAKGYTLAVATGKGRRGMDAALRVHDMHEYFVLTITAEEAPSKPAPDMLQRIAAKAQVPCADLCMVGDSIYDIEMAVAAGSLAVGVTTGVHQTAQLIAAGAEVVLPSVLDLPEWLNSHHE